VVTIEHVDDDVTALVNTPERSGDDVSKIYNKRRVSECFVSVLLYGYN
jgi:hypothetical protein